MESLLNVNNGCWFLIYEKKFFKKIKEIHLVLHFKIIINSIKKEENRRVRKNN